MARVKAALAVRFQVFDPFSGQLREVARQGRLFEVDGRTVKLVPISVLAEAMDRVQRTIVDWERVGKFPKPLYAVPGSKYKRWYSEAQVHLVNNLWLQYRKFGRSKHFPVEKFLTDIAQDFYRVDLNEVRKADSSGQEH